MENIINEISDDVIIETILETSNLFGLNLDISPTEYHELYVAVDGNEEKYFYLKSESALPGMDEMFRTKYFRRSEFSNIILKDSLEIDEAYWKKDAFKMSSESIMTRHLEDFTMPKVSDRHLNVQMLKKNLNMDLFGHVMELFRHSPIRFDYLRDKLIGDENINIFLAVLNGNPVGSLIQFIHDKYAVIGSFSTKEGASSHIIGATLMNNAFYTAANLGLEFSLVRVSEEFKGYFERFGFVEKERLITYKCRNQFLSEKEFVVNEIKHSDVLKTKTEIEHSVTLVNKRGIPMHPDIPKNWDSLAALNIIMHNLSGNIEDKFILDAGGEAYSSILPLLESFGFKNLYCINLVFRKPEKSGHICYEFGDITKTRFQPGTFDAITCMSVVEHGVDLDKFFAEMQRILKPGGLLIISSDYWFEGVDTRNQKAYGADVKIFDKNGIIDMVKVSEKYQFSLMQELQLDCGEKTINCVGLEYTFIYFTLEKRRN